MTYNTVFMKRLILIMTLLSAMFRVTSVDCHAQQSADVQRTMDGIVMKHEESQGVSCIKVVKGKGLEMLKMMFNKEFGKDFMKGVSSITLIEYGDASEETCKALRKDMDAFLALLREFDVSKERQFDGNDYLRCFASVTDSATLSDFVIALENDNSKMLMYMAGKIEIE